MFTGIVEEIGTVAAVTASPARIVVDCTTVVQDAAVGDSISVNGCCLTVTERTGTGFAADLMGETLARTGLGGLAAGDPVNLERALRADGRLGGHLVQGHVDGVGVVAAVEDEGEWTAMRITLAAELAPFVAEKGSIAVDGTSLTVTEVTDAHGDEPAAFAVGLIPHTLTATVLGHRRPGDAVNLETDVVAKHVARLLQPRGETKER